MEIGERTEKRELSFDELLGVLEQATILQQALYAQSEEHYNYERDVVPIYKLFQGYKLEWSPPEGQEIIIPEAVGQHPQIQQAEYHNEYPWVYPSMRKLEPILSADKIEADTDGIYAYVHYGRFRVVLFRPDDRYNNDPAVIKQLAIG